jgi:hypothetical protein
VELRIGLPQPPGACVAQSAAASMSFPAQGCGSGDAADTGRPASWQFRKHRGRCRMFGPADTSTAPLRSTQPPVAQPLRFLVGLGMKAAQPLEVDDRLELFPGGTGNPSHEGCLGKLRGLRVEGHYDLDQGHVLLDAFLI